MPGPMRPPGTDHQIGYADTLRDISREFRSLAGTDPAAAQYAQYADTLDNIVFDLLMNDAESADA